ncbi:MAG TPA: coproporphyrinogen III oxidase, partial [Allocoleopsis sp.]
DYYQAIDNHSLPISKCVKLNADDILRRDVIMQIMSNFQLDKAAIESKYHINFDDYFASELICLQPLEKDRLINLYRDRIEVTPLGRLLVRNIAVVFDAYTMTRTENRLSKTI